MLPPMTAEELKARLQSLDFSAPGNRRAFFALRGLHVDFEVRRASDDWPRNIMMDVYLGRTDFYVYKNQYQRENVHEHVDQSATVMNFQRCTVTMKGTGTMVAAVRPRTVRIGMTVYGFTSGDKVWFSTGRGPVNVSMWTEEWPRGGVEEPKRHLENVTLREQKEYEFVLDL